MTPGDIDSVNHIGIAVRNLDEAVDRYQALGFILSPLSVHSGSKTPGEPPQLMATGNRCAIFPNNYVELLGIVNPGLLDWSGATSSSGFKAPTSFVLAARTGTWWTTACAPTGLTRPA
jgi:hypothetical protein